MKILPTVEEWENKWGESIIGISGGWLISVETSAGEAVMSHICPEANWAIGEMFIECRDGRNWPQFCSKCGEKVPSNISIVAQLLG